MNYCTDEHCLTCSDEIVSARVVQVYEEKGLALVEILNRREEVDITLVEQVIPGTFLLVHGGVAIAQEHGQIEEEMR